MYNFKKIEKKWQEYWDNNESFKAVTGSDKKPYYILVEFPYPSGSGLHVGHVRSYTAQDALARMKRREGYNVLYPMGWDAFGAPAEQYAIKNHIHPKDAVTVRKGDIVTYKIRVYNEGDRNGYATEVTDYLPEGLGFLPNYTNNSIWSIPKTTDEATGKEVLPEGIEIKNLVGENGFYKDESEINKDKIKLEDFKDPITGMFGI